jgi:hypothetical protein
VNDGGSSKNKVEDTKVKVEMNKEKMGLSVKNLYSQFIYRITKLGKINIAVFSKPLMFSGIDFEVFRNKILSRYTFEKGFIFKASEFDDVSTKWGVSFSILKIK